MPYFGGVSVFSKDRQFRIDGDVERGWWRFRISGRSASAEAREDPPDLSDLRAVKGHFTGGYVFVSGREVEHIGLLPEEEPPVLTPVTTRRWHSGDLVLDCIDFEDEAEDAARRALEERLPIGGVKAASPSLRAAFSYALAARIANEEEIPLSPLEVLDASAAIAERGTPAVTEALRVMVDRRREQRRRADARIAEAARRIRQRELEQRREHAANRAAVALEGTAAQLVDTRNLAGGNVEVTFRFMGERFISVVDGATLQVYDAGICLDGADELLTLDSLPAAIREAVETGQLHITRR